MRGSMNKVVCLAAWSPEVVREAITNLGSICLVEGVLDCLDNRAEKRQPNFALLVMTGASAACWPVVPGPDAR